MANPHATHIANTNDVIYEDDHSGPAIRKRRELLFKQKLRCGCCADFCLLVRSTIRLNQHGELIVVCYVCVGLEKPFDDFDPSTVDELGMPINETRAQREKRLNR